MTAKGDGERNRDRDTDRSLHRSNKEKNPYFQQVVDSFPNTDQTRIPAYLQAPQGILFNTIPPPTNRCALSAAAPKSDKLPAELAPSQTEHSHLAPPSQTSCREGCAVPTTVQEIYCDPQTWPGRNVKENEVGSREFQRC